MHERISVEETDDHLRIKVRWRSGCLLPLTVTFFAGSMVLVLWFNCRQLDWLVFRTTRVRFVGSLPC